MTWTKPGKSASPLPLFGLVMLYAIAVVSVVGFGVFKAWPSLLATLPGAMAAYPKAIAILPRGQILFAVALLAVVIQQIAGWRWLPAFIAIYAISLSSELLGTTVGLPFGPYEYTSALGLKWFAHVPVLIPLSWFMMAVPSFALARASKERPGAGSVQRIVIASLILLAWDLSLDPAMSAATAFWVWGSKGPYYGMPLLNLFGWFVTGVVLMSALDRLHASDWIDALPRGWIAGYYGANLTLSLGLAVASGMWWAVVASVVALSVCWRARRVGHSTERVFA